MHINSTQSRVLREIKDILSGAAFPIMLQLVISATVIFFADYGDDNAIRIFCVVVGEAMLIAAYVIFGKQNGIVAYKKTVFGQKKSQIVQTDENNTSGEYAVWRGIAIGAASVLPYVIFQLIYCVIPNKFCEFILKYAFGWAVYVFKLFGINIQWLNLLLALLPIAIHTGAYIYGGANGKSKAVAVETLGTKNENNKR